MKKHYRNFLNIALILFITTFMFGENVSKSDPSYIINSAVDFNFKFTNISHGNVNGLDVTNFTSAQSLFLNGAQYKVSTSETYALLNGWFQDFYDLNNTLNSKFAQIINDFRLATFVSCPLDVVQDVDAGVCTANVNLVSPEVSPGSSLTWELKDALDNIITTGSGNLNNYTFNVGVTKVIYTADDVAGPDTCSFTVTVEDNIAPTASNLVPVNVECSAAIPAVNIIDVNDEADNCTGTITVAHISDVSDGNFNPETITRTYSVTDDSTNSINVTQIITVEDVTDPTASNLSPVNVECSAAIPAANINDVSDEADNCAGAITVAHVSDVSDGNFNPETITRTYSVTDASTNSINVTQIITVDDVTAPVADITSLTDITAECEVTSLTDPTATDNCGGTVTVSNNATLPISGEGTTTVVTWTYDDGNGNSSTQTQDVIINDVTPPVADITSLADITAECEVTSLTDPTATDNCGGTVTVSNNATLPISGEGTTTVVTWTYDDGNGNTSTQTQNVIINDVTPPVSDIASLADITAECEVSSLTDPTATDNCGGIVTVSHNATFPISGEGTTTVVTWTYDDGNGNSSTQTQDVIINDVTPPVADIASLADITAECEVTSLTDPTATDNCGGTVTVSNNATLPISGEGTTTVVTWTYDDGNGNTSTQTQDVIIKDTQKPTITTCPGNVTVTNTPSTCAVSVSFAATATDNCNTSPTITYSVGETAITSPYNFPVGTTTVDVIADDENGQTDTCSFNVTILDAADGAAPFTIDASSVDICEGESVTFTPNPSNGGTFEWFVHDTLGNLVSQVTSPTFTSSAIANGNVISAEMTSNLSTCGTVIDSDNAISMTVNDPVDVSFSISGPSEICAGEIVTYSHSPIIGGGTPTLQWTLNGNPIFGADGDTYTTTIAAPLLAGDEIALEVISDQRCATPVPAMSDNITISIKPDATISSPSIDPQTVCIDTSIQPIEFTIAGGGTGADVTGLPNGVTGNYNNGTYTVSGIPTDSGIFDYTVTTTGTCAQTTASGTITVTPNATIVLDAGSANADQSVCAGSPIENIVYTIDGSGDDATVSGLPADIVGNYLNGTFTISGSTTSVGTFPYTVTATGPCAQSTTLNGSITINPILTPSVTIASSDADNTICSGTSVTFTAAPTNGGTLPAYQWQINNSNVLNETNSTFTPSSLTDGQIVRVILTSNAVCASPITATSDGILMTVNPNLTPSVSIVSNRAGNTICVGDPITFSVSPAPTNGGSNPTYQWQVNNVNVGSNTSTSTFSPTNLPTGATVRVIMTSNETCLATPTATSTPITVTVNPILEPSVSIASSLGNTICNSGNSVTFTATPTNGGTTPSYQWQINNSNMPNETNSTFITPRSTLPDGTLVSVIMTSNVPCPKDGIATVPSNIITMKVYNGAPDPVIITGQSAICPPISLNYSIPNDPNVLSYTWSTSTPAITIVSGQNSNQVSVNFGNITTSNNYIRVVTTNSCGSTTNELPLTFNNFAYVNAGPDQYVCAGTNSVLLAGSIGGVVTKSKDWTWSSNGGSFSNGGNQLDGTYTFPNGTAPGTTLTVTISTTNNVTNGTCTGNGSTVTSSMKIYVLPNPTASVSISGANPICPGNSSQVTFGATGFPNSAMTLTYKVNNGPNQTMNLTTNGSGVATANLNTGVLNANAIYSLVSIVHASNTSCSGTLSNPATVTVNPNSAISTPDNKDQTVCVNTDIAPINFTISGGGTGATISPALPAGLTGNYNSGTKVFTISGTPSVASPINYTVTTSGGGCSQVSVSGSITVNPNATITTPANKDQTICVNTAITPINFTVGAGGTGASVSPALPTGLTSAFSNGVFTISGTPTVSGPINYTVSTSGGCSQATVSGSITVNPNTTISPPANKDQAVCANEAITPINFTIGNGGTGADVTGLPASLSSNYSGGVLTITGTPITSGTINYTVNTTGGCAIASLSGAITVNANATISTPNNKDQTICVSTAITPINFTVGAGGTGATVTPALPTGLTSAFANGVFTISGTPTVSGSINYTVNTTGNCTQTSESGIITVNEQPTVTVGTDQDVCSNQSANVVATLGGGASSGTWMSSGTGSFANNAATTTIYNPTPADISSGSVTLTYTANNPPATCVAASDELKLTFKNQVVITTQPQNKGVCVSNPASFSVAAVGDNLTYEWYKVGSPTALANTSNITGVTSTTLNFASASTTNAGQYYVVITGNAACAPVTSNTVSLNVNQTIIISSQPASQILCEGNNASFTVASTGGSNPISYQWFKKNTPSDITLTDSGTVSGATSINLQISNINSANAGDYYVVITGSSGTCPSVTSATANLAVTQTPIASISYSGTPFCSDSGPQTVTFTGTTGGEFTANPTDLTINASTGAITPSPTSTGTYTITYTILASGGCPTVTATTDVTITAKPTASISYVKASYCKTDPSVINVTLTGANAYTNGTFSASPDGSNNLSIHSTTGQISATSSDIGTYTVTYSKTDTNGCSLVPATTTVKIDASPVATFNYGGTDFCTSTGNLNPIFTGGGLAGTFTYVNTTTSPSTVTGLSLNSSTGAIDLANSTAGNYTITNTIAGGQPSGCADVVETFDIYIEEYISGGLILLGNADDDNADGSSADDTDIDTNQIVACHQGTGTLYLPSGTNPAHVVEWQYSTNNGPWLPLENENLNPLIYEFFGLEGLTAYRVKLDGDASSSACGPVYSAYAFVSVIPYDLKPQPVSVSASEFCLGGTSQFSSTIDVGGDTLNEGGNFQSGQLNPNDPNGWLIDGEIRGWTASGSNEFANQWSGVTQNKTFNGTTYNSGQPKFGITYGVEINNQQNDPPYYWNNPYDNNPNTVLATSIETPRFSLLSIQNPTFEFDEAYQLFNGGAAIIEISLDGGETYIQIPDNLINGDDRTSAILQSNGSTSIQSGNYNPFGDGTNHTVIDLNPYFGNTDIRIRLTMIREATSVWAIDNFTLPNNNGQGEVQWTDQFDHVINPITGTTNIQVTPSTPGNQTFTVTSYINGCRSIAPDGSVDVQLEVHYANAGYNAVVDASECGSSVIMHAYDNSKSPLRNYIDLNNAGLWDNNNPLFPIIDEDGYGDWDVATQNDMDKHNPTANIYTYTNLPNDITLADGTILLAAGNYRDYGTTNTTQFWTIASGPAGFNVAVANQNLGNYFSNVNDPQAEFFGPGGDYRLQWNVSGSGTIACSAPVEVTLSSCATLDFDGIDDNVTFRNDFKLDSGPFSIEVWVKPDATNELGGPNNGIQTILSKRDANDLTTGYDLRLVNNKISFNWNTNNSFTHTNTLTTNRWYHVAVTYNGSNTYKMYIDGIHLGSGTGVSPLTNNFECIMGAMDRSAAGGNPTPINYYSGWLDELRIWDTELTVEQIRQMMNQEITVVAGNVQGSIVPLDIPGLNWANLDGYYRMNQLTDIVGGYVVANAGTRNGQMRNIDTWQLENSPLPYTTRQNGNWSDTSATTPWTFGDSVWDAPNSIGVDNATRIDWNIVRTSNDITSDNRDLILLGLLVDTNELTITGNGADDYTNLGTGLWITHYLKIDGKIDLVGESQLVQKGYNSAQLSESFFDSASTGILERDQQGISNPFNYNYWSSPVAPGNASVTSANVSTNTYSIGGVLRDGTTTVLDPFNNSPITWIPDTAITAVASSPIQVSTRWLHTYANNPSNTYAEWLKITNTDAFNIGLGYSMKGSANGTTQNYVFVGKPNNGTIINSVAAGNDALLGNPYPSAIDAEAFIADNGPGPTGTNSLQEGSLHFWEHYTSNLTHVLRDYQGGYAVFNLLGAIASVTPDETTDGVVILGGSGTRIPERYVPVGQGFFVTAIETGGNVTFKNSQRVFKREGAAGNPDYNGSIFFKNSNSKSNADSDEAPIQRVRVKFNSPEGASRPLLLGFEPNNLATDGVDYGYDASNYDTFPSDMSWMINGSQYVIQGVGAFENTKKYPFAMHLGISGKVKISLTGLENFDEDIDVYVYDSLLETYHQINDIEFETTLDAGNYDNRFFLTFKNDETLSIIDSEFKNVVVKYLQSTDEIYINTPTNIHVKQVYLINIIGQTVKSWNSTNMTISNEMKIPVKNLSEGNYIIKIQTDTSTFNKKVIVKY